MLAVKTMAGSRPYSLHEGTCSGDKFLEVFTRRNFYIVFILKQSSRGLVGTKMTFSDWFILILSRGHVAWTVHTRRQSHFLLFCRRDMSPQFKLVWIQGTCRGDKILSPRQDFFLKIDRSHEWTCRGDMSRGHVAGTCRGDMSPGHVPSCVPTLKSNKKRITVLELLYSSRRIIFLWYISYLPSGRCVYRPRTSVNVRTKAAGPHGLHSRPRAKIFSIFTDRPWPVNNIIFSLRFP